MIQTDVAVIGAGLAGSIAAHHLATAGVKVTLIEKATFPRDKSCGDGVMSKGLRVLERVGLGEWAAQFSAMKMLRLTSPDEQILDIPLNEVVSCPGRLIPRLQLDARLAQAAVDAGAQLLEDTRVRNVEVNEERGVSITAAGAQITAPLVILADGSHAAVTRRLGLIREPPELVAVRQYLAGDASFIGRLEIHFRRSIIPGYTWLFPMGDGRINVGTGTYTRRVRGGEIRLQHELRDFIATHDDDERKLANLEANGAVRGHPLRTRLQNSRTHAARILVAGDAAGLVSPFTGEGIAAALNSGERAAIHALTALKSGDFSATTLAAYSQELKVSYNADQQAARFIRSILSNERALNRAFRLMQRDAELAQLFGQIFVDMVSPRRILRPQILLRLLTEFVIPRTQPT